jgi:hypothetical protein
MCKSLADDKWLAVTQYFIAVSFLVVQNPVAFPLLKKTDKERKSNVILGM